MNDSLEEQTENALDRQMGDRTDQRTHTYTHKDRQTTSCCMLKSEIDILFCSVVSYASAITGSPVEDFILYLNSMQYWTAVASHNNIMAS